ncbi:MAG: helix-turn-helix transcriptional regulator [Lachnospiraceae bacterium]|nr:helix-turn-helix transcriptional regulator [Lachnospiraceae bacterium]
MTFTDSFLQALANTPTLPAGIQPTVFLGKPYTLLEETDNDFLTILSGGTVEARDEYAFSLLSLNCRMLLYTKSGNGVLRVSKKTHRLTPGTLLYLNCSTLPLWEIGLADANWQYTVFFIKGDLLSNYEALVSFSQPLLISVSTYSNILPGLEKLLQYGDRASLCNKLTDATILNGIITELFIEAFHMEVPEVKCPSYLLEIRQSLDTFFMDPFRLEDLENKYHISKYRICREFSNIFGLPPLKYLNKRRIEIAKNLLLSTDKHIHEIANEVGYENTNHFINLFKKETGLTPLVYRETIIT